MAGVRALTSLETQQEARSATEREATTSPAAWPSIAVDVANQGGRKVRDREEHARDESVRGKGATMFDGADGRRDVETELPMARTAPLQREIDWREADRQLRRMAARRGEVDAEEARWLLAAQRAAVHRHLGFGSFAEYVERILGYAPRTTRERLRVAEALERLPATRDALASGRVAYSAVRELSRVATTKTEDAWLDAVAGKTLREVDALLAGHAPGDDPTTPGDPDLVLHDLHFKVSAQTYALFLEARRRLDETTGERLSDDDLLATVFERVFAEGDDDATRGRGARAQIALTVCEGCGRGWQDAAGEVIAIEPAAIERARCDAQWIGRVDGDAPAPVTTDIAAAVRRQVERRDHGRCAVPGCRSSRFVELHHVTPRANGGGHDAPNLVVLCTAHHLAYHDGRLDIRGRAPHLTFLHADGRPYGAPPPGEVPQALRDDACSALRNLGFSAHEAAAAVAHAMAHASQPATIEDVIRAALRACRPPPGA